MLRSSESETEILLGNKQLLGIFFLVAVLIGVAFGGGYMLGRGASDKKTASEPTPIKETAAAPAANATGGETRTVSPSDSALPDANTSEQAAEQPVLGSPKHAAAVQGGARPPQTALSEPDPTNFAPLNGQEFLQVAALPRGEALSVADVLRKKGFQAHAVPVPSNPKLYRVIVGPVRDVADLSSTREELRKTGFGKVIVQKY
jgi:cell division septation protein DedD